jgi:mono/diheme cytochrome c family protein
MQQLLTIKLRHFLPNKTVTFPAFIFAVIALMAAMSSTKEPSGLDTSSLEKPRKDSIESVKAFMQVYQVLMSPRCMNCHPSGDVPLQGEDSHLHAMQPQRGKDGRGLYAMKCANCHQAANTPGLHMPPGNPNWHMPPADMKMVFQGRTPHQLAKQLIHPAQNGHKSREQLLAHAADALVIASWNPGEGRTPPPLSQEEFAKAWVKWIKKGAYAPAEK